MTPGSPYAIAHGCHCPILGNSHGKGYLDGVKTADGYQMFWVDLLCPIHREEGLKMLESLGGED
jgi:hypothetical protein